MFWTLTHRLTRWTRRPPRPNDAPLTLRTKRGTWPTVKAAFIIIIMERVWNTERESKTKGRGGKKQVEDENVCVCVFAHTHILLFFCMWSPRRRYQPVFACVRFCQHPPKPPFLLFVGRPSHLFHGYICDLQGSD